MNIRTQAWILVAFGVMLMRLASGDQLLLYVNPSSRIWVMVAGFALASLGGLLACGVGGVVGAGGGSERTRTLGWALLAPIAVVALVAPPALGSFTAVHSRPISVDPGTADYPALSGSRPVNLTTLDFVSRALSHHGQTVLGHRVRVTGFALRRTDGGFVLSRLVITCCAADAAPVFIGVLTAQPIPRRDEWVTVVGTFAGIDQAPNRAGSPLVRLAAVSIERTASPVDPYEH